MSSTKSRRASDSRQQRTITRNLPLQVVGTISVSMAIILFLINRENAVWIGVIVIILMISLMLLRIPVAISMIIASTLGLISLRGLHTASSALGEIALSSFTSWSLSVVPMFVLMGVAMGKSGISNSAFQMARKWFGRLPGGLAISTNFAGAGLAAASGSTMGITYALGRTAIPEMFRAGYKPNLAMGSVAMSGTLGQVIPPSILLVIYASIAQVPVGPQLLAGILPGILLALSFAFVVLVWSLLIPSTAPRPKEIYTWSARISALRYLIPVLIIVIIILGGIYSGVLTATEAGAVGALAALAMGTIILVVTTRRNGLQGAEGAGTRGVENGRTRQVSVARIVRKYYSETFFETVTAASMLFFLILAVNLLTRVMALSGFAQTVADWIVELGLSQTMFLLLLIPIYIILGAFLDPLAMMLLTIPVFMPPLVALDVNLIWFGVFLVILAEIALVSPPLGILNFVVLAIGRSSAKTVPGVGQVSILDVFRGVAPLISIALVFLVSLVVFPEVATWLPEISQAN